MTRPKVTAHKEYHKNQYVKPGPMLADFTYDTANDGPETDIIRAFRVFPESSRTRIYRQKAQE